MEWELITKCHGHGGRRFINARSSAVVWCSVDESQ